MHRSHKYPTQNNPEPARDKTVKYAHGGTYNGTGTRDGGKMMAKKDVKLGGNIILAIVYPNSRSWPFGIHPDLFAHIFRVETDCQTEQS